MCGRGWPTPEDCGSNCWSPAVDGRRDGKGWRAPCPICQAARALEYSARGNSIWWNSFCDRHDKDTLRPVLRGLLGPCMPGRLKGPVPVRHDELAGLALSGMPHTALKVRLLELSGMSITSAMDKLGIDRTTRYRIRQQLSQFCDKAAGR